MNRDRSRQNYPCRLRRWPRRARRSLAWLVLLGVGSWACAEPYREWSVYGGDQAGTKYSALAQIDRSQVQRLKPAWVYRCDDMGARSTIECNPIIVDGLLYLTTPGLKLVALDAATGVEKWVFDPWEGQRGRGVNRGVTYWAQGDNQRIFFAAGNHLYAVGAADGKPVTSFGTGGRIDLREGLDRDVSFLSVSATSPAIVYKDTLIIGSAVGESPRSAPGHIRAFDAATGERRWIFHTIPHPGEFGYETWSPDSWKTAGGANCWGGMTLDEQRGLVFAGTGSAAYDHFGGNRVGSNLFANSILALKADTGDRVWHFQTVHHDLWDYDIPCPPNLISIQHGGRIIDAVAQVTKQGHTFVLNRETGEPLFPVEERPVPPSEIPGEQSWPTQPFPTHLPPFAQQRFTADEVTDLSPESREFILKKLESMVTGDVFTPPGLRPSVVLPQFNGGAEWGGAAFDPTTRLLYVNSSSEAEWISMVPAKVEEEMTLPELGRVLYGTRCSSCHVSSGGTPSSGSALVSLASARERLARSEVLEILETGRNQMPAFPALTAVEKQALLAFIFGDEPGREVPVGDLDISREIPYVSTGHHEFRDQDGFPANQRPWGTLTALDLDQGEIRWQVPLGTYPALEAKGIPPTGTFNMGGPLVTAGGLVFIGAAMDERFHAFDKSTGELLWEFQMEAGGYATPATYEVGGRQFVVIAAGGGGKPGTKPGNAYYCFALPESE